jgi:endoribonuclease Dicer
MCGNTVAFLEMGTGKTLIAVLLLCAYAHRVRGQPGPGPRSFAVFLVPTVMLVGQQARAIQAHTDLRIAQFYGEMGVDIWSVDTWQAAVEGAEVLIMMPQILLDNLRHSFFRLQDTALLIFDECHRAKGNSPYACILKVLPSESCIATALCYFCQLLTILFCSEDVHLLIWISNHQFGYKI